MSVLRILPLALLLLPGCSNAPGTSSARDTPSPEGWVPRLEARVNDYAGILTSDERTALEASLDTYERETTHQVAVLTVSSLKGEAIEDFFLRVANTWGLGQKAWDNGILVTVAPTERQVRIELGFGMNRFISDADAKQIIDETMLPAFRAGHFGHGIKGGVERLMTAGRARD
jgi:uncharacterized protein